jgi:superfamily II DNA or RNA helicase
MTSWRPFASCIQLHVPRRISEDDARRQEITAREILNRLSKQPGLVLADEVGMGKTFVALAVATSVALSDQRRRPVVVMVPPSLKEKWPQDFAVFAEKCLPPDVGRRVRPTTDDSAVSSAEDFLRLLDDPIGRRRSIIFLTHGAMHRGLSDGWVKLAIIQRALYRRHHIRPLRIALSRCLGKLLYGLGWVESRCEDIWDRLLDAAPEDWLKILHRQGIGPHGEANPATDDDPVPQVVVKALRDFNASDVYDALQKIPYKWTATWNDRVADARRVLASLLKDVWRDCLQRLTFKLPLLIMDEAHHLKNPETQLSSLFQVPDARDDADEITRGALGGVFERMLFLTATPFQLGHHELCSVLERFDGIAWDSSVAPAIYREGFQKRIGEVRERLDAAQQSALNLDAAWGLLRAEDLIMNGEPMNDLDQWWTRVKADAKGTPAAARVFASYQRAFERMRAAEQSLQPWVIRHLKPRQFAGRPRRERMAGAAITDNNSRNGDPGLEVSGPALLPFLLAARATVCAPDSRPVFAEGLASSYEAFLHTRQSANVTTDIDDDRDETEHNGDRVGQWYLEQLERALPLNTHRDSAAHPKVAATAERVLAEWRRGEKVVVFCHYIATGRVLRHVISGLMHDEIDRLGAEKIGCAPGEVAEHLDTLGNRFFDVDSPVRRACDIEVADLLSSYPSLASHRETLIDVTRRYLRTPSFLVRYFPLNLERLDEAAAETAFGASDASGLSLRSVLRDFFDFLESRCGEFERQRYLAAVHSVQTGAITGREAIGTFAEDELQGGTVERLLPNVRLVNGATRQETRQRLMLTFNSPFFPEVLIASSVLAEGVDLHRFCRYVIHHDLCWNPSTLEQRTGRVDRIGAKVEQCGQPIHVYLPYLAETQDEKMYRVVMDRERWFSVVMGEQFKVDARTTEKWAQRVPLPASLAQELTFRLGVAADIGTRFR